MTSLIAAPVEGASKNAFEALPIVKDVTNIFGNEHAGTGFIDVALLALDTAAMIVDPIAALSGSIISWAMTYMDPLPSMMDDLVGSPTEVAAQAQTWMNIKAQLDTAQGDLQSAVDGVLGDWEGTAADTYRGLSDALGELIGNVASSATGVAGTLTQASQIIELVRTIIIQLVSSLVGALISWGIELLATVGFGTPAVVSQAIVKIGYTTTKAASWTDDLVETITSLSKMANDASKLFKVSLPTIRNVEKSLTLISAKHVLTNARTVLEDVFQPNPQVAP